MIGQLHQPERELLYNSVLTTKPKICVECGTWKGGGSTYFITKALHELGEGILHTFEINETFHNIAKNTYIKEQSHLQPYVKLYLEDFCDGITRLNLPRIDFAFLDGPENGEYSLKAFQLIEPFIPIGGYIVMHDWKSEKSRILNTYLLDSWNWGIDTILNTEVGICRVIKNENNLSS